MIDLIFSEVSPFPPPGSFWVVVVEPEKGVS